MHCRRRVGIWLLVVCLLLTGCGAVRLVERGARRVLGVEPLPGQTVPADQVPTDPPVSADPGTPIPEPTPKIPQVDISQYAVVPTDWEYRPGTRDELAPLFISLQRDRLLRTTEQMLADGCTFCDNYSWQQRTLMAFIAPAGEVLDCRFETAYLFDPQSGKPIASVAELSELNAQQGEDLFKRLIAWARVQMWKCYPVYYKSQDRSISVLTPEDLPELSDDVLRKDLLWLDRNGSWDYYEFELSRERENPERYRLTISRALDSDDLIG